MSADTEARFAHLLQPIRDLTQNWNIDIASELEEYLNELEHITFSFDGDSRTLNFAEAALLIQGSACIYSKKVEYLYSLLYQTLDLLLERKKKKETSTTDAPVVDGEEQGADEPEFLELDDLVEAKGIDLVDESSHTVTNFNTVPRAALALLSNLGSGDISSGLRRNDFRMNTCTVDKNGALLLSASPFDAFGVGGSNNNSTNSSNNIQLPSISGLQPIPIPTNLPGNDSDSDDDESDDDIEPKNITLPNANLPGDRPQTADRPQTVAGEARPTLDSDANTHKRKRASKEDERQRGVNMWALLEPHEDDNANKPLAKGKTYRIPKALKKKEEEPTKAPELRLEGALSFTTILPCRLRGVCFPEFAYLYNKEAKRKNAIRKNLRTRDEEEEEMGDDFVAPVSEGFAFGAEDPTELDSDDESDDIEIPPNDDLPPDVEIPEDEISYHDHARQTVAASLSEANKYLLETAVSRAVNEWRTKLDPVLAEQESHPPFDMQAYGMDLIGSIRSEVVKHGAVVDDESGEVDGNDLVVPFSKLTIGTEQYEVARKFAAILQLINNRNVDVDNENEDTLSFRLLSTKPRFDIDNYRAPSLQGEAEEKSSEQQTSSQDKENVISNGPPKKGAARRGKTKATEPTSPAPPKPKRKKAAAEGEGNEGKKSTSTTTRRRRKEAEAASSEEEEYSLRGPRTRMEVEGRA